jgi:hypothetical protein
MVDGFCKKELSCGKVVGLTYNDLLRTLVWVTLPRLGEIVRANIGVLNFVPIETLYLVYRGGLIFIVVDASFLAIPLVDILFH